MIITICGSMKVADLMKNIGRELKALGHTVHLAMPREGGVDYWAVDGSTRVAAKRTNDLIRVHARNISSSDAVLVVNATLRGIPNYIGGNTFLEMGYAHIIGKPIYLLNPVPDQPYIADELAAMDPIVLHGDLAKISQEPHHVG